MSGCKYRTGHLSDPPKTGSQYSERPSADHEEEILKKRIRINVFSIISTQHICCHGFSKPSRSAYTDKTLFRFQNGVGIRNQSTFININFGIQGHLIIFIAGIRINTHLQEIPSKPNQQCLSISYETPEEVSIC